LAQSAKSLFDSSFISYQNGHITIFLDSFATGCSLPSFPQQFEINGLEVDRSYVNNLKSGLDRYRMCEANIMVAHKLKLKLIAQVMAAQQ
jgi:EAL domain-containing protein (putative c-di-GMP-specific phosphodiesterase class I)